MALAEGYERVLRTTVDEREGLSQQLQTSEQQIEVLKDIFERYQKEKQTEIAQLERKSKENLKKLMKARQELDLASRALQQFHSSIFWKMTKPLLRFGGSGEKKVMKKFKVTRLVYKGLASVKDVGIQETFRRARKMSSRGVKRNFM